MSGDRGLLTDRLAAQIEDRLVLRLADREDYRLAGLNPRDVASDIPPGRALRAEAAIEVQVALLGAGTTAAASGQAQAEAVRAIGAQAAHQWPPPWINRPMRVDTLPAAISPAEVEALAGAHRSEVPKPGPAGSLWVTIGVGGDELTVRGVDLAASGGLAVAGPPRSGRSTALLGIARAAAASGAGVVTVCPRPSPLTALEGLPGVTTLGGGVPGAATVRAAIEAAGGAGPTLLVVDDADTFAGSEADETVRALVREDGPARVAIVAAGPIEEMKTQLRGVIAEARRARTGLLLSPASSFDGDLVGVRLAPALVGRQPPGRGYLLRGGECLLVQVPLA